MANYLYLYSGGSMPESEADQKAVQKVWDTWFSKLGRSVVDQGRPIMAQGRTVSTSGRVIPVTGGTAASGYSIIKTNSLDEAVRLAQDCPILKDGGTVTVYETSEAMG
jgi:hypothetical protein